MLAGAVAATGTLALYSMRPAAARQAQGRDNREYLDLLCLDVEKCWDSGAEMCVTQVALGRWRKMRTRPHRRRMCRKKRCEGLLEDSWIVAGCVVRYVGLAVIHHDVAWSYLLSIAPSLCMYLSCAMNDREIALTIIQSAKV